MVSEMVSAEVDWVCWEDLVRYYVHESGRK